MIFGIWRWQALLEYMTLKYGSSAAEIQAVERRERIRIFCDAIPKEHMRRFHGMDDAKEIWEAIRTRFGGNANSKKMQKAVFKQQFKAFKISNSEGLEKGYDRFQQLLSHILEAYGVPPPLSGDYTPGPQEEIDDSLSVQLNAGRPQFNSVRPHINTGRTNINSVRPKVNTVSPKVNTVSPKVNTVRPRRREHPLKNMVDRAKANIGKGKIRVGNLDFDSVSFVKELGHFNLFSISQICDKQHKVLFTETECLVVSSDFKMPDENQILLKSARNLSQPKIRIFDEASYDEEGVITDFNSLLQKIESHPYPTLRIHSILPKKSISWCPKSAVQTRSIRAEQIWSS
ncbi:hypothetical protein Tco_0536489 [Tanacetum coccineum]